MSGIIWKTVSALLRPRLLGLVIAVAVPRPVCAGQLTDELKSDITAIITVLNDPALKTPDRKDDRRHLVCSMAAKRFNWETMARQVMSHHWDDLTRAQREEFVETFSTFIQTTYLGRVEAFLDTMRDFSAQNIAFIEEQETGRNALVTTRVCGPDSTVLIGFRLHRDTEAWLVTDVTVDGAWLVENYRNQCDSILAHGSFEDLRARLDVKFVPQPGDWQQ